MDPVLETDMTVDAEFLRGLAQIVEDRRSIGNRLRFFPWAERVGEGEHVGVGTNAGKAEQVPGATNRRASLENHVSLAGTSRLQTVAGPDSGKTGTDDHDIEVLNGHMSQTRHRLPTLVSRTGPARRLIMRPNKGYCHASV